MAFSWYQLTPSSMAAATAAPTSSCWAFPLNKRVSVSSPLNPAIHFHVNARKSFSFSHYGRRWGIGVVPPVVQRGVVCASSSSPHSLPEALLFDCDGVLVDTEKDGHRISFNDTFAEKELGVTWDVDLYGELLKIGGGKERMTAYFNKTGWPANAPTSEEERKTFIASLHKRKTELFMVLIEKKLLPLRPGVARWCWSSFFSFPQLTPDLNLQNSCFGEIHASKQMHHSTLHWPFLPGEYNWMNMGRPLGRSIWKLCASWGKCTCFLAILMATS